MAPIRVGPSGFVEMTKQGVFILGTILSCISTIAGITASIITRERMYVRRDEWETSTANISSRITAIETEIRVDINEAIRTVRDTVNANSTILREVERRQNVVFCQIMRDRSGFCADVMRTYK